jgi:phage tail-like protein
MSFGKLEIKFADGKTAAIELTKPQMILGRSADVDIPINDTQVSRRHAVFLCGSEGVRLVDAGSANGTYLSGARLPAQQPVPLQDGAQMRVGQTMIKFVAAEVEEASEEEKITAALKRPGPPPPEPKPEPEPAPQAEEAAASPDATASRLRAPTFAPPPSPPAPTEVGAPEPAKPSGPPIGMPIDQSSYLKYLPSFYSANQFLGRMLLIFEHILTPLDRRINNLHDYFDPRMAPPDFLPWLAAWLGLVLDERWPEGQRRELIRSAVELYEWRGTKRGVSEFVRLYTGFTPEIAEPGVGGKNAKADQAHRFIVRLTTDEPDKINREVLQSIIDMEKPAHAGYSLEVTSEK